MDRTTPSRLTGLRAINPQKYDVDLVEAEQQRVYNPLQPRTCTTNPLQEDTREKRMSQYKGEVKWFNNAKGYGFLGSEGHADVFCHYSSIQGDGYKSLKEGEAVEFNIVIGNKGKPQAEQVQKVSQTAS